MQEHTSHVFVARRYRRNAHTGDNLRDGHLKGPDIQPVGDRVPPRLLTGTLFDLYFAH